MQEFIRQIAAKTFQFIQKRCKKNNSRLADSRAIFQPFRHDQVHMISPDGEYYGYCPLEELKPMTKPTQSFVRGTFVLSAAALINRILGFVSGIYVARVLGAEGIGLLMMAHPLVPLVITITELGLPVAISKLVAEAHALGERAKVKRILRVSLAVTGCLSVTLTTISLLGSEWIAAHLLSDQRAYYTMLAITPIAPIVAVSAVLKGYFRGMQKMKTIAASDVLEYTVQIACVLALVHLLMPYGIEYAAAGAMAASVVSEAISLLFLFVSYKLFGEPKVPGETWTSHLKQGKSTLAELLRIGLPTTGYGVVHSIYGAFQPLLITSSLAMAGIGTALATKQFGMIAGYVFPLLFMPALLRSRCPPRSSRQSAKPAPTRTPCLFINAWIRRCASDC